MSFAGSSTRRDTKHIRQIGVLYFTLYYRLLYEVGYIVVVFDVGFRIFEYQIYHFQAGTLHHDVCTTQATRK